MHTLYRLHTNMLIIGALTIGFAIVMVSGRAYCLMTVATVIAYISQLSLMIFFSRDDEVQYSGKVLFLTTIVYCLLIGTMFMCLSYYHDGDTFMFSKADAMFYYNNAIKSANMGFLANAKRIIKTFEFDDCGSLIFDSFIMYLIPNKLFLNAIYMLSGALSSVMLFRIGEHFMPRVYAFLAAMTYGTSSYLIFFHCTFLKESIFVFIVVSAFYFLYKAIANDSPLSIIGSGIFICLLMFFRPAVAAMIIASIMAYYAIKKRNHAISVFLYIGIVGVVLVMMKAMMTTVDRYTAGGDMDALMENSVKANYSTGFNSFVGFFSAFFGPFPSLFPRIEGRPITINFYGAGLTYRTFLILPFWIGVFYAIKQRAILMVPLTVFVLFEMLVSGYVMASMELRKVMPHMPFIYTLSYYGLSQVYANRQSQCLLERSIYLLSVGIMMLWVVIRE